MRRAVIVAPHPDDEAIGAFGLIRALMRRGARCWVVVVADGAASHPGSMRWPPHRLVRERRRETRRAMRFLRIPPSRIAFLELPDGALCDDPRRLERRIGRALRRVPAPDLIVGPVAEDAHADHRATAAALARRRSPHRLGYQVWPLRRRRGFPLRLPLDRETRAAKRRIIRSYRTQAGLITDSPTGMAIRPHHLHRFAGPAEFFKVLA